MDRVAIFVDTGYLCTGGAMAVAGQKCSRSSIRIDVETIYQLLEKIRQQVSGLPLLRIYWYDGSIGGRMTTEQTLAARRNDIKLRLGIVNGQGEQKEVDTKLVTDLADLARNKSIADAILVAGDGDLRLGVELAQQYGVRVHLVTLAETGVSEPLKMEADTWHEITVDEVRSFLTLVTPPEPIHAAPVLSPALAPVGFAPDQIVATYLGTLSAEDLDDLRRAIEATGGKANIPSEHNGRVLGRARDSLQRDLVSYEKAQLRNQIKQQLGL